MANCRGKQLYGFCLGKLGRYEEGEKHLLEGLRGIEAALGADHWRADSTRSRLADLYEAWGKPDKAAEIRAHALGH